jgi:hypothetical protein
MKISQVFLISASLRNEILEMTSKFMTGPFKDSCKFMTEEKLKEKGRNRKEKKRKKKKKEKGEENPFILPERKRSFPAPLKFFFLPHRSA